MWVAGGSNGELPPCYMIYAVLRVSKQYDISCCCCLAGCTQSLWYPARASTPAPKGGGNFGKAIFLLGAGGANGT